MYDLNKKIASKIKMYASTFSKKKEGITYFS